MHNVTEYDRLEQIATDYWGTLGKLAVYMGKSHAFFYTYKGKSKFGRKILQELENIGINTEYIETGNGSVFAQNGFQKGSGESFFDWITKGGFTMATGKNFTNDASVQGMVTNPVVVDMAKTMLEAGKALSDITTTSPAPRPSSFLIISSYWYGGLFFFFTFSKSASLTTAASIVLLVKFLMLTLH